MDKERDSIDRAIRITKDAILNLDDNVCRMLGIKPESKPQAIDGLKAYLTELTQLREGLEASQLAGSGRATRSAGIRVVGAGKIEVVANTSSAIETVSAEQIALTREYEEHVGSTDATEYVTAESAHQIENALNDALVEINKLRDALRSIRKGYNDFILHREIDAALGVPKT